MRQKWTHDNADNHDFRRFGADTAGLCRANAMEVMSATAPPAIRDAGFPYHYALHDIMVHRPRLPLEATHGVFRQEATEIQPRHMDKN